MNQPVAYPICGPHDGCEPLVGGSCKYSHNVNELCSYKVYNVGITILNHPWLGMVNIPTIYGDDWGMVYGTDYTHTISNV